MQDQVVQQEVVVLLVKLMEHLDLQDLLEVVVHLVLVMLHQDRQVHLDHLEVQVLMDLLVLQV